MTNRAFQSLIAASAAITMSAAAAAAQTTAKTETKSPMRHETQAQLKAEAKISLADARKTALAAVPNGTITSSELEREKGKLIYSFDIATKGKSGIDEVNVDAITGAMVGGVEHESPKAEAAEAKAEKKKP